MHPETIDAKTKRVWEKIAATEISTQFYLAGGTALAIHLGHRMSIDLDFFSPEDFSIVDLKKTLSTIGKLVVNSEEEGYTERNFGWGKSKFFAL